MNQAMLFHSTFRLVVTSAFLFGSAGCKDNCGNENYRCHDNVLEHCQTDEADPDGFWAESVNCGEYGAICRQFKNKELMDATYVEWMSPPPDSPFQCIYESAEICDGGAAGDSFCVKSGDFIATCGMHGDELLPVVTQFQPDDGEAPYCVENALGNGVFSYFEDSCEAGQHRCYTEYEALRCENNVWQTFENCYLGTSCTILVENENDTDSDTDSSTDTETGMQAEEEFDIVPEVGCVLGPCTNEGDTDCLAGVVMICRDGYYRENINGATFCD